MLSLLKNQGSTLHPTVQFSDDISKMYQLFCSIHPPNDISKEIGVVRRCVAIFKNHFPSHADEVLLCVAKEFTNRRLRKVNKDFITMKPRKGKKGKGKKGKGKGKGKKGKKGKKDESECESESSENESVSLPLSCRAVTNKIRHVY